MNIDLSQINHEDLEFLVADLLLEEGLTLESRPAVGPDAGKDLLAIRHATCSLGYPSLERILVECKHTKANVSESDLGYYEKKMEKHGANRYLLVTTSSVTESVRNNFESTNNSREDKKAIYWTKNDLKAIISKHECIYERYFVSWDTEINKALRFTKQHFMEVHKGALLWSSNTTFIFGNDGYSSDFVRNYIEEMKAGLDRQQVKVLSFKVFDGGYSWGMLVDSIEARALFDMVWESTIANKDKDIATYQKQKAYSRLVSFFSEPHQS
ncbi:TPA: restriction endonuclease [Vibrio parahaemolyticus]|uniref:restriction endonuclease n=1 Tax=Vibrio TaxID=662 RepID=UPI000200DBED|nr:MULTISPECIES: restriction endonuclease [Vibrio]ADT89694.1 hypothetical protein vfu_B01529 [Vibrio furnissii NCTC 11218]EHK7406960.1 restriction endonuclease [Vibrio parahaemolyticus]EIA3114679.1 restriction endonuclease [Vibrio cholerae]EJL6550148.1 restriction endonuclease [Vibrio cholerae]ELB8603796.1 restriction endonuclease [Vibrio cholerae]